MKMIFIKPVFAYAKHLFYHFSGMKKMIMLFLMCCAGSAMTQVTFVKNVQIGTPVYPVNGKLLFAGLDEYDYWQLWVSDGTNTGTTLLKSFYGTYISHGAMYQADNIGWRHYEPIVFNNELYFFADTFSSTYGGTDLWKSDGTVAGTVVVKQLAVEWEGGPFSGGLPSLCVMNNSLYFACGNNSNGVNLWKTDGTTAGTTKVINLVSADFTGWGPAHLVAFNNNIYFTANDDISGPEVWKSDGTAAGTHLLKDIFPGQDGVEGRYSNYSGINPQFTVSGNYLYFTGYKNDDYNFFNLYRTDGTTAGTIRLDTNIFVRDEQTYFRPFQADANGTYFFTGYPNASTVGTSALMKSDGTVAGTAEIMTNNNLKATGIFTGFKNKLYFAGAQGINASHQYGLCVSDGSTAGTSMVFPFPYASSTPEIQDFLNTGNSLFFRALMFTGSSTQYLVVQTGGTTASTTIHFGASSLGGPVLYNDNIYFYGNDTASNTYSTSGLYKLIPVPDGTLPVTLTNFTAVFNSSKKAELKWQTVNEINANYFSVERSENGNIFYEIAKVKCGNNPAGNNYSYEDIPLSNETIYYRLKEVDTDGKFTYSKTVTLHQDFAGSIKIIPNPAYKNCTIYFEAIPKDKAVLKIFGMDGRQQKQIMLKAAQTAAKLDLSSFAAGIYLCRLEISGKTFTQRLIVAR
ncbi:MAG: T9SS type A sorting domain-containing protein [Ferruginibacter sp.]